MPPEEWGTILDPGTGLVFVLVPETDQRKILENRVRWKAWAEAWEIQRKHDTAVAKIVVLPPEGE